MYLDEQTPGATPAGTGWQVDPDQVRQFADAVSQVRAHLDAISKEVNQMSTPNYAPLLGTSPVGQQMAEKFSDRMGADHGLRGLLNQALKNVDEFVASAEQTVAAYEATDDDRATGFRYS